MLSPSVLAREIISLLVFILANWFRILGVEEDPVAPKQGGDSARGAMPKQGGDGAGEPSAQRRQTLGPRAYSQNG